MRHSGLDHLRALAIAMVVVYHYRHFPHPEWIDEFGEFGWTGVDLFYVLSGYLISSQLFAEWSHGGLRLSRFFIKRAFRILPAFWVVLGIYFCVPEVHEREALAPLHRYLTFTQNFGLDFRVHGTFSHAWSLCVEEQFYLALPVALWIFSKARHPHIGFLLLPILCIAGFVSRALAWTTQVEPLAGKGSVSAWYQAIYYPTYQRLDGLILGIAIAACLAFSPRLARHLRERHHLWLLLALGTLFAGWWVSQDMRDFAPSVVEFPLISLGYAFLVASVLGPTGWHLQLPAAATAWLAQLSYAIYLVHKGVNHVVQTMIHDAGGDEESTLTFVLCVIVSIAVAALLHAAVERPALKLGQRLLSRYSKKTS